MAAPVVRQVTPLNAGHPLTAITATVRQAAAGDATAATAAASGPAEVTAGSPAPTAATGTLTVAGVAAVLSALSSYYTGLSAVQKAQLGHVTVEVTSAGLKATVRGADVATVTSTLATTLNTGANYGPAGT